MRRSVFATALLLILTACPRSTLDPSGSISGFTDGPAQPATSDAPTPTPDLPPAILGCPGETQCPCDLGCPDGQICGPTGACTQSCRDDSQCTSGVSGESCIANLCGVPCDPLVEDGGCGPAGMVGASCIAISPTEHYCGYAAT
jgi:hypothetical protein